MLVNYLPQLCYGDPSASNDLCALELHYLLKPRRIAVYLAYILVRAVLYLYAPLIQITHLMATCLRA